MATRTITGLHARLENDVIRLETRDKIIASAQTFNVDRVNQQDVATTGGGQPPEED